MVIRIGFDLEFTLHAPSAMILMLHLHPSRAADLIRKENLQISPGVPIQEYTDSFGNLCARISAPAGKVRLWNDAVIADGGQPDPVVQDARQYPVDELPPETLRYLLASRYCEVDRMGDMAWNLFGGTPLGWARVQAIVSWVHNRIRFDYQLARRTRSAYEGNEERVGVCRDFTHLAITLCRCMNIPARYATGYLGDIGVPISPDPMDFSAWMEVFLGGRWHAFDPRHDARRIGRILMAVGRDAADVALTTTFGSNTLDKFEVWTDEVVGEGKEKEKPSPPAMPYAEGETVTRFPTAPAMA